jgi:hypothetical protein
MNLQSHYDIEVAKDALKDRLAQEVQPRNALKEAVR